MTDIRRIGVMGGGQLGRMMALAGVPLGFRFVFLDPAGDACAADAGDLVVAAFDDTEAALGLAGRVDVVTYDFENVPRSSAEAVRGFTDFQPGPRALGLCQDRMTEKSLLQSVGIEVPPYRAVDSRTDLLEGLEEIGWPAVLKTRRLGYDGKGQRVLRQTEDLERAWQRIGGQPLILEAFVPYEVECSIIGVRGRDGAMSFWPLTRNIHDNGILLASRPGVFGEALQSQAESYLQGLAEELDYVGVLTIEFFLAGGRLLANEIAPRVHNSGHWTIDGAVTSQFENHVRAIAALPAGDTSRSCHCVMINCIGAMPERAAVLAVPGAHHHDYAKAPRDGRKVGHVTLTADSEEALRARAEQIAGALPANACEALETILDIAPRIRDSG